MRLHNKIIEELDGRFFRGEIDKAWHRELRLYFTQGYDLGHEEGFAEGEEEGAEEKEHETTNEIECEKCAERISERKSAHIGPFVEIPTQEAKRAFLCGSCALCFPFLLPRKGVTK